RIVAIMEPNRAFLYTHAKTKKPFAFHLKDGQPLAFRGVWEHWKAPDGNIELHTNLSPCLNEECRPTPAAIGSFPVVAGAASLLEKLLLFPFVRERTTIYPAPSVYETRTGVM